MHKKQHYYHLFTFFLILCLLCGFIPLSLTEDKLSQVKAAEILHNPKIKKDSSMRSGQKVTWDCVWFGSYPQTEITSSKDLAIYTSLATASESQWTKNNDIIINGTKYRRLRGKDATLYNSNNGEDYYNWNDDDTTYHYFKYEPIKWRILKVNDNSAFLLADIALDNQLYNTNWTDVTWKTSSIRSWLNGYGSSFNEPKTDYSSKNFINSAFSPTQQNIILTSTIINQNNISYNTPGGDTTSDKIFLLSESEVYNTVDAQTYGFLKEPTVYDEARRCLCSTYAAAMGALHAVSSDTKYNGNTRWLLRSPGTSNTSCVYVTDNVYGVFNDGGGVTGGWNHAIRPALHLNLLSSASYSYAGTVCSDGTINENAKNTEPISPENPNKSDINKDNYIDSASITYHYSASNGTRKEYYFPYSDYMFYINDYEIRYGKTLAQASLATAMSAFSDCRMNNKFSETLSENDERRAANIKEVYQNLKFSNAKFFNYNKALTDSSDKAAFSIAQKYINRGETINDTSQGEDTVLAIVVRGGGYGAEWASNFNVINNTNYGENHYGFSTAAQSIESAVDDYVKELKQSKKGIQGKLKVWITGYSRGSAIANKVAHDIMANGIAGITIDTNNMYAYTFATPNVGYTNKKNISYKIYPRDKGIFNIVSPLDIVPRVPLSKWNYGKYGHTLYLPTDNYPSLWEKYCDLSGKSLTGKNTPISTYQKSVVNALESMAEIIASDQVAYRIQLQDILWKLMRDKNQTSSSLTDTIKNNIILIYEEFLKINPSSKSILSIYLEDKKNGPYLFTNLGRAHEPEYYMSRIELDNLENQDGFKDGQIIKEVSISIKNPDIRVQNNITYNKLTNINLQIKDNKGSIVGGIADGNTYSKYSVICDKDTGVVIKRDRKPEISINSNKIDIFFYDNNYTINLVSDANAFADITVTELDDDLNSFYATTHNNSKIFPHMNYILNINQSRNGEYDLEPLIIKIKQITLTGLSKQIAAGKKLTLKAKILPGNASNQKLTWKSSNKKVATVNSAGVVRLKRNSGGKKVKITATTTDGSNISASWKITSMKGIVKKVRISGRKTVKAGKTLKLKAKVTASRKANKKLLWKSSNTKYATVNSKGVVKAKKSSKGKSVKITAMATDGSNKKATIKIKVK